MMRTLTKFSTLEPPVTATDNHPRRNVEPLRFLVLPGDGIGPEITAATLHVIDAVAAVTGRAFELDRQVIGLDALSGAANGDGAPGRYVV